MGLMLRRRMMPMKNSAYNWRSITNLNFTNWRKTITVSVSGDTIVMSPTGFNWNTNLMAYNLLYKIGDVKDGANGYCHLIADFTISNLNGAGAALVFADQTTVSPDPTNSTTRDAWGTVYQSSDSEGHIDLISPFVFAGGTVNNDHYIGLGVWAHTGTSSVVTLSNCKFEVDI